MRKNSVKNTRINGEVQRVLAEIIRGEIKDPRISLVQGDHLVDPAGHIYTILNRLIHDKGNIRRIAQINNLCKLPLDKSLSADLCLRALTRYRSWMQSRHILWWKYPGKFEPPPLRRVYEFCSLSGKCRPGHKTLRYCQSGKP